MLTGGATAGAGRQFAPAFNGEVKTAGDKHSIAQAVGITLHIELLYGSNNHHIIEGIFKGFARAMRQAVERDPRKGASIPSTKGLLGDGTLKG